jgi:hypothetical protein
MVFTLPLIAELVSLGIAVVKQILPIFDKANKVAPIIDALPITQTMDTVQTLFGKGQGTIKAQALMDLLKLYVQAGLAVSKGGQLHTMEEFNAAIPHIQEVVDTVKTAYNNFTADHSTVTQ